MCKTIHLSHCNDMIPKYHNARTMPKKPKESAIFIALAL